MIRSKNKIVQLITSIQLGGAEIVAFNITEGCSKDYSTDFEFIITELFPSKGNYAKSKRKELESKNIRIITLSGGNKRLGLLLAPWSLFLFLLKEKPQIIHSHTDLPDFVLATTIKMLNFFRLKYGLIVRTIHNTVLWPGHPFVGKYTESAFRDDQIVGVSEASLIAYKNLRQSFNLGDSCNLKVIYNGCSKPSNEKVDFQTNNKIINIAFCGRFEYQKGIDILIERIREINKVYSKQIQFFLIGDGTFKSHVKELVSQSENVVHLSPVNNISNKLHVFDYIIMPSRFEGLVLISIEASYARVPVIAARASGLSETLPADWPLLFNLDDSGSLMTIIQKIINNEFDTERLKNQAEEFVTNKFSLQNMVNSYSNLYKITLNSI